MSESADAARVWGTKSPDESCGYASLRRIFGTAISGSAPKYLRLLATSVRLDGVQRGSG